MEQCSAEVNMYVCGIILPMLEKGMLNPRRLDRVEVRLSMWLELSFDRLEKNFRYWVLFDADFIRLLAFLLGHMLWKS